MRACGVPEVHISILDPTLHGAQKAKPGNVIFYQEVGYYITRDIGELPENEQFAPGTIAMEGHTLNRTLTLLFIHSKHLVPPHVFEEVIEGGRRTSE